MKPYNNGKGGVDIMNQETAAYRLNRKRKYCFYMRMFFDLIDFTLVKSHTVYTKLGNDISLMNFKIVTKAFVDTAIAKDRSPPVEQAFKNLMNRPCLEKSQPTYPNSS